MSYLADCERISSWVYDVCVSDCRVEQVIYTDSIAESVLHRLLERVDNYFENNSFGEVEVGSILGMVNAMLNIIACIIKHQKFEEEKEYRQIFRPGSTGLEMEPFFRAGQFGLTPYVKIQFLEKGKLPLENVTVGPCQDFDIESNALKILLGRYGYEGVEVLNSEIPLRV